MIERNSYSIGRTVVLPSLAFLLCLGLAAGAQAEPFKLQVEEKGYGQSPMQGYADYPAPQMVPQQGMVGAAAPLKGSAATTAPPPRPPLTGGAQQVALPPQFLGVWNVSGQRVKVEAMPEFQSGAERAFAVTTQNTWRISGDPNSGYAMGNDAGVNTQLVVDKVQGNTAFIRYQHPIGNTMAQEAIVMTLEPGGAKFNALERVSIVKQGLPQPRAKVTYQLTGYRQR